MVTLVDHDDEPYIQLLSSEGGVTSDVANTAVSLSNSDYQSRHHVNQSSGFIGCRNSQIRRAHRLENRNYLRSAVPETLHKLDNRVTPRWHLSTQIQLR